MLVMARSVRATSGPNLPSGHSWPKQGLSLPVSGRHRAKSRLPQHHESNCGQLWRSLGSPGVTFRGMHREQLVRQHVQVTTHQAVVGREVASLETTNTFSAMKNTFSAMVGLCRVGNIINHVEEPSRRGTRTRIGKPRRGVVEIAPGLANFAETCWSKSPKELANIAESWSMSPQNWPKSPNMNRHRPRLGDFASKLPASYQTRPGLVDIAPECPHSPDFRRTRLSIGQTHPTLVQVVPEPAKKLLEAVSESANLAEIWS